MSDMGHVGAGPAKPRDEAAISHRRALAVSAADNLLREMLNPSWRPAPSTDWHDDIRRVRGLLAEWRLETE